MLLSREFIALSAVSFLIGWPVAFFIVRDWLHNFAYRIDLGLDVFLLSGLITVGLVAISIGMQAWRAATADPVDSLRYE